MKIYLKLLIQFLIFIFLVHSEIYSQCNNPPNFDDPASQNGILESMNIPCAWTITNGNPNVTVAVLDGYLDNAHDDLVGKVVEIVGDCDPEDQDNHHGIQSLGAAAGIRDNGICIAGSGGDITVAGFCECAANWSIEDAVIDHGYRIVSVSCWWNGAITRDFLEEMTAEGAVILLAGLNQFHEAADPAGLHIVPGVIHVGRAHQDGSFWPYLNNHPGPNMNMDVLVITEGMWRILEGNSCEESGAGTSIGTPVLAGVVGLMRSVNPCLFPADVEEILVQTAAPSNDPATRAGVIDAFAAVQMAQNFSGFDRTWSGTQIIEFDQVSGDLTVETGSDITLTNNLMLGSESILKIKSGSTLTVTGQIEMGNNAKIIVERGARFVVEGGTLTTLDCATQWEGIIVEGNSAFGQQTGEFGISPFFNGIVEIIGNSVIENAHTCISMNPTHIPWPATPLYWGGYVFAENSTFRNTTGFSNYRRVAEFMQYEPDDNSQFINCVFEDIAAVGTHWGNHGVTYDDCEFFRISRSCTINL